MSETPIRRAIQLAVENVRSGRGGPFGAVVTRDGEIVAEGVNTVTLVNDPTAHAEVNAIREACRRLGRFDLRGCEIHSSCEPCPMCLGAIYWARLDRVWYAATRDDAASAGFDDSFLYAELPLDPARRSIPAARSAEAEGAAPFDEWARSAAKIRY